LIQFQIEKLRQRGIEKIVIVTGYEEKKVRDECGDEHTYILNEAFRTTNSLCSLSCAREHMRSGCLVFNSDVLFHGELLDALLESHFADAILVDFRETLGEEEMEVQVDGSRLTRISKEIAPWKADGENLGLVKLSAKGAALLIDVAEQEFRNGNTNEIDYVHDFERARSEVYPLLRE